jgi:FkbM family methyltransferase
VIITDFDVAILDGDTHISRWVLESRSLRIAEPFLKPFAKHMWPGRSIVDAGAMIGDHTLIYSEWVSQGGQVFAFEPNPEAFECLEYNMRGKTHVHCLNHGLADSSSMYGLNLDPNVGASHLSEDGSVPVPVRPLDDLDLPPIGFMKIDVEGFETRLLRGAVKTIEKYRPVILSEVNHGALEKAGTSAVELLASLKMLGYQISIAQNNCKWNSPQYDILCIPKK